MQKAGPDLLIPAPPRRPFEDVFDDDFFSSHHPNALPMPLGHEAAGNLDVHLIEDRLKLQAKIDEEYQQQKTLEKPEMVGGDSRVRTSSLSSSVVVQQRNEHVFQTVPPAPAIKLPLIVAGEDKDTVARERRDKVKEGGTSLAQFAFANSHLYLHLPFSDLDVRSSVLGVASLGSWWDDPHI
ncbi:hypothetical protein V1478_003869 [Vespula squamosa]|uniref:Uncharacterized protein n=1 Tax=Vespula squamosa TaxID=30214 RepID=A0ABD2BN20_VESSQ